MTHHVLPPHVQIKYKEEGRKEMSVNLYSLLPETAETQFAKEVSDLQSEVREGGLWLAYQNKLDCCFSH